MAGTPGTPTCSARPSTGSSARTLRGDGSQDHIDHGQSSGPARGVRPRRMRLAVRACREHGVVRPVKEPVMTMDTFVLLAGRYAREADATADYDAIKDVYERLGLLASFD